MKQNILEKKMKFKKNYGVIHVSLRGPVTGL